MLDISATKRILQIGAGGVGAPLAQHLSLVADELIICDGDKYEDKNITRQPFAKDNEGRFKADVLCGSIPNASPLCQYVTEANVEDVLKAITPTLIVLAVDCDKPRKLIFDRNDEYPILWGANEVWAPQAGLSTPRWRWSPLEFFEKAEGNNEGCGIQTIYANIAAASMASTILQTHLSPEERDNRKAGTVEMFVARIRTGEYKILAKELEGMSAK